MPKVLMVANSGWGLANFRLPLALALADAGMEVAFVSPFDEHVSRLKKAGFRWIEWGLTRRSILPTSEVMATLALAAIYKRERPDAVQHFAVKAIIYGTLASSLANVRSVTNTFTGVGFPFLDTRTSTLARPLLKPLITRLLHRPNVTTVFHNAEDRQFMVDRRISPSERSLVISGSGVDTDLYRPRAGGVPNAPPTVLMVARMLIDKGVREFVGAADTLAARGVGAKFQLAGSPDTGSRLSVTDEQYKRWRQESAVEFLGFRLDTAGVISSADIAVLPSYHEGLPMFLLEAMACGLPVVATDVVGCRSLVEDGVNGLLVPAKNVEALVISIERLIRDPRLRSKLGTTGRRMAIERFDERRILPQYAKLLTDQLAGAS